MSRSNPTENLQNPCARWIEWDGSAGAFRYYDKMEKKNVSLGDSLTFILLDQTATIKGWHDSSDSGIYANEIRDIKQDVLVVKAFKGGLLAEGQYGKIRDRVIAQGGHFTANLYVAIKTDADLVIGSVQFKGAALAQWMEFAKAHRADLYKQAVRCKGFVEGKKGKIVFRTPVFHLAEVTPETDAKALDCDRVLQEYLKSYFSRTRIEQVAQAPVAVSDDNSPPVDVYDGKGGFEDMIDDIPF